VAMKDRSSEGEGAVDEQTKDQVSGKGDHFPCPGCGGQLEWNPAQQQLKCPYCDLLVQVPQKQEFVAEEHDLLAFLEEHPKAEGYGVQMDELSCKQCGATVQVPKGRRDLTCPFCASIYVIEAKAPKPGVLTPESVIPFKVDHNASRSKFKEWIGTGWFRPNDLQKLGTLDRVLGLYLPFFTFDALARSIWSALAGFYYYVTERVAVQENGKTVWRDKQVQKVRWEPASGKREDFYDDVLVPAVQHERLNLIMRVYPYETKTPVPYDSKYLSGFGILNADMPLKMVYDIARKNILDDQRSRCSKDVPGDTQKDLSVQTELSKQTFKHLLCPVWVGSFKYKGKVFPFVVNGQTGKLYGEKPWSWVKIAFALMGAAAVLLILFLLFHKGG
jgi:DNA-directed RNA polymerase subunit RPC12/RpoP